MVKKRYKMGEEHKKKISLALKGKSPTKGSFKKGHKHSEQTLRKIKNARAKQIITLEHRRNISLGNMGKKMSEEAKHKIRLSKLGSKNPMFGKIQSEETVERRISQIRRENHWNWKNGKTSIRNRIKSYGKYLKWRSEVLERDNYHCQGCGKNNCKLDVHHIIPIRDILEFYNIKKQEEAFDCKDLWDIDNGMTVCRRCHQIQEKKTKQIGCT